MALWADGPCTAEALWLDIHGPTLRENPLCAWNDVIALAFTIARRRVGSPQQCGSPLWCLPGRRMS